MANLKGARGAPRDALKNALPLILFFYVNLRAAFRGQGSRVGGWAPLGFDIKNASENCAKQFAQTEQASKPLHPPLKGNQQNI